jgi:hypothetical protein
VAFNQKFVDEQSKREVKEILTSYDRSMLVADPRRCEPKKFGGKGARSRKQKSYRWKHIINQYIHKSHIGLTYQFLYMLL